MVAFLTIKIKNLKPSSLVPTPEKLLILPRLNAEITAIQLT